MALSEELKRNVVPLWEKTVTHPFVMELGDGTLPEGKFRIYFEQDHLFMRDWIALMCGGVARAPDFASARPLAAFIDGALRGEEGLFQQFFTDVGLAQEDVQDLKHLPTNFAYSGFLRRMASDGSFVEIIATLLGIEWPYLDWARRLVAAGKRPENRYYQVWIDIHAGKELEEFVTWMRSVLDNAAVDDVTRLHEIFLNTLRYEYLFWEMAYKGERWPE